MYSKYILERFQNPEYAGGLRGANGTGKATTGEDGEVVKIYIAVNDNEKITNVRFKAYGGVCTIVACDVACEMLERKSLEDALRLTSVDILEEIRDIPESKEYTAMLVEEAIKNAVENYYKKKEKEEQKNN